MNDKEMTVEMIAESLVDELRGEYTKRLPPFDEAVASVTEALTKREQRGYRLGQEDMRSRGKLECDLAMVKEDIETGAAMFKPGHEEMRKLRTRIAALPISPQPQQESEDV